MHQGRIEKVLHNMKANGFKELIISAIDSIFYLTGHEIHPGERMMVLYLNEDGEHRFFVGELFPMEDDSMNVSYFKDTQDCVALLAETVKGSGVVGVDKEWAAHFLLRLMAFKPDTKFVVGSPAVDFARLHKDAEEAELMRKSSAINDVVMAQVEGLLREDKTMTEVELIKKIEALFLEAGADGNSFDPLICYGKGCAEPHHSSDGTKLNDNESIIIDMGCRYKGYCSDMTRSFFYGEPNEEYKTIYELVRAANQAAIAAVKPGVKFKDIDAAARNVITAGGYGDRFIHRTGHGIGINVHEFPDVSAINEMVAAPGMIFSIEPGVYVTGKYGVRVEDLVMVTEDGCEVLNYYPRDLTTV